jgi:hypothetical protein
VARTRVELDERAVRQMILKSPEVLAFVRSIGDRIASAAGPTFEVQVSPGKTRNRVIVIDPDERSLFREAETGALRRAVQGARI